MIQRVTHWDAMTIFRVFPAFWYALMPMFVYLIARRYLIIRYAVVSSLVIIFSSYMFFFPDVGRVGIALGFAAGMLWALLTKRMIWAVIFALLVVLSHYGAAVIAIGAACAVFGFYVLRKLLRFAIDRRTFFTYGVVIVVLVASTAIWHFGVARYSGDTMFTTLLQPEKAQAIMGDGWGEYEVLSLEDRDDVTQRAFGVGFATEPTPAKIEILSNWSIVGLITLGLVVMVRRKDVDLPFKVMAFSLYGLILTTIAIPQLSIYYGTQRVYFTAMILLSTCLPSGAILIGKLVHISPMIIIVAVLSVYAASASGLIYIPFGLAKSIPVIVTVK
jgi:uncharacterized membrane protein